MHTKLQVETPNGFKTQEVFKVDTGTDGNIMPITMFFNLFPKISLDTLEKTSEQSVNLYAYNNTPLKQLGMCSVKISFKKQSSICKFYVVEHNTAIVGIHDSEKLCLVNVNFDVIEKSSSVKVVHEIIQESDLFKKQMESEFPELFKGIGCMDGEITIKLCEGAIPYTKPIRRVPHAM